MNAFLKKVAHFAVPILTVFVLHYVAANMYAKICADLGFLGFLTSFMTTGSPVCNALLNVINATHNSYSLLIAGLIGGLVAFVTSWNNGNNGN
jgi:hypothetical protein